MSYAGRVDQYGNIAHLHERDTTIAVVSRAPIEKINRWKRKMGWTFPWYSSFGSRFNFDYGVSFDETVGETALRLPFRGRMEGARARAGRVSTGAARHERVPPRWRPGVHTYSTYARGTEQVGGTHYYLDMTALGRQEDWEEPKGRSGSLGRRGPEGRGGRVGPPLTLAARQRFAGVDQMRARRPPAATPRAGDEQQPSRRPDADASFSTPSSSLPAVVPLLSKRY